MSRQTYRLAELGALILLGVGLIILAGYMIHEGKVGEAFGSLIGVITITVQAVTRVGQAEAMNKLADHLANSTPARKDD